MQSIQEQQQAAIQALQAELSALRSSSSTASTTIKSSSTTAAATTTAAAAAASNDTAASVPTSTPDQTVNTTTPTPTDDTAATDATTDDTDDNDQPHWSSAFVHEQHYLRDLANAMLVAQVPHVSIRDTLSISDLNVAHAQFSAQSACRELFDDDESIDAFLEWSMGHESDTHCVYDSQNPSIHCFRKLCCSVQSATIKQVLELLTFSFRWAPRFPGGVYVCVSLEK
jgi:hypothetical protein